MDCCAHESVSEWQGCGECAGRGNGSGAWRARGTEEDDDGDGDGRGGEVAGLGDRACGQWRLDKVAYRQPMVAFRSGRVYCNSRFVPGVFKVLHLKSHN